MRKFIWLFSILLAGCAKEQPPMIDHTRHQNTTQISSDKNLMLSDGQMRLANITTQRVTSRAVGQTSVLNATLVKNEALTEVIASRASGRIEKLYIKETGRTIKKGQPLYEIYSESLLTLQKEFLLAKEQAATFPTEKRYADFLKSAERKLSLYGQTHEQIAALSASKEARSRITFLAPSSGVITEANAAEGQYVDEGASLYKVEDTSKLWLEAELYPSETSLVKIGDIIDVKVTGFETEGKRALVTFLSPEFRLGTQVIVMRASVDNVDMKFKPGMQAQVFFTHSSHNALAIPADAVIRSEKGKHVYIQQGKNNFRAQQVQTGIEDFTHAEITEGLKEGDTVAVTGAYLLYSEMVLRKGFDPMEKH